MPWHEHKDRINCMLFYPYEDARLEGPSRKAWNSWPVGVQAKLNGERCRDAHGLLLSSTEEIIYSVPHIRDYIDKLNPPFEMDGELYKHGLPFDTTNGIHSIVSRTRNLHPDYETMQYHVFDIASDDPSYVQLKRSTDLKSFFHNYVDPDGSLKLVSMHICSSRSRVHAKFEELIAQNYEGIIVRHMFVPYKRKRSIYGMKFKPKQRDDYKIIGWTEEHSMDGTPKNRIGTLTCISDTGDTFDIYSGLNDFLRDFLWDIRDTGLVGRIITVHYQNIGVGGVPIFGRVDQRELKTVWEIS